jgi:hypothetical protein
VTADAKETTHSLTKVPSTAHTYTRSSPDKLSWLAEEVSEIILEEAAIGARKP